MTTDNLDFDGNGSVDGLFRQTNMISGHEFHATWFVDSIDAQFGPNWVLDEATARKIIFEHRLSFERFGHSPHDERQFVELVELNRKPYVLIGRAFYWTLKDTRRYPRIQLLKRTPDGFRRVCLFDGQVEITREW
jgi:hypothetical protein